MANVNDPTFEEGEKPDGFRSRRARIGYELGTELSGASLFEVPPGEDPTGEAVRFLAIASSGRPDVIVYPDSDKIGFGERLPRGGGLREFFHRDDRVGYFEGEQPPTSEEEER
jgi:hypothetical protein